MFSNTSDLIPLDIPVLGKDILVNHDIVAPDKDGFYRGEITLLENISSLLVNLRNVDGETVKQFSFGSGSSGDKRSFNWDGGSPGAAVGDFEVLGVEAVDAAVAISAWATIVGVRFRSTAHPLYCTTIGQFASRDVLRFNYGDLSAFC